MVVLCYLAASKHLSLPDVACTALQFDLLVVTSNITYACGHKATTLFLRCATQSAVLSWSATLSTDAVSLRVCRPLPSAFKLSPGGSSVSYTATRATTEASLQVQFFVPQNETTYPLSFTLVDQSTGNQVCTSTVGATVTNATASFVQPAPSSSICSLEVAVPYTLTVAADPLLANPLINRRLQLTCYNPDTGAVWVAASADQPTLTFTPVRAATTW